MDTIEKKCVAEKNNEKSIMDAIEEMYVLDTYNDIAKSFDKTRYCIWKCVLEFFSDVGKSESILDVGCGNGKNMKYLCMDEYTNVKGCDFCEGFVNICIKKELDVIHANILCLPFTDSSFDKIICIAVIHHLSTHEHRLKAIKELIRVTKPGGKILITVSSYEYPFYKGLDLSSQNVMVPWKNSFGDVMKDRYYYLFKELELENLCIEAGVDSSSINGFFECDNWIVVLNL
jgi:ubiquinone/menaquinone biosynthesis C-methylase UbiE